MTIAGILSNEEKRDENMDGLKDILSGALLFIRGHIFIQGPLYLIDALLKSPNHLTINYLTTDALI